MTIGCFAGFQGWDCSMLWFSMVFIFFLIAIFRRQVASNLFDIGFSMIIGTVAAEIGFVIVIMISKDIKIGLIVGLILGIIGGFVGSVWDPTSEGGEGGGNLF